MLIQNDTLQVGEIPEVKVYADVRFGQARPRQEINGNVRITSLKTNAIKLNSAFKAIQKNYKHPAYCFDFSCDLENIRLSYYLEVDKEVLRGEVTCEDTPCFLENSSHQLTVENTNAFFTKLGETKLFNPIGIAIFYSQIVGGSKIGNGHFLSF